MGESLNQLLLDTIGSEIRARESSVPDAVFPKLEVARGGHLTTRTQGSCYLIERGIFGAFVDTDQVRWTCVGILGSGDMIGVEPHVGLETHASEYVALTPVVVARIPDATLGQALSHSATLRAATLRQLLSRLSQTQRLAACNARHTLPARCATWLLRLSAYLGETLPVTHEFLANMLGVRRAGITTTLQALQIDGAIAVHRGATVILDQNRLRRHACDCAKLQFTTVPIELEAFQGHPGQRAGGAGEGEQLRDSVSTVMKRLSSEPGYDGPVIARIEAALGVCHAVIAQTQALLGSPDGHTRA